MFGSQITSRVRRSLPAVALAAVTVVTGASAAQGTAAHTVRTTPTAAAAAGRAGDVVHIVSSQSNLLHAGVAAPALPESVASATPIGPQPPAHYKLWENFYKSPATCASYGKRLISYKVIDRYWCTPVKQENGRYWLYVYSTCSTDLAPQALGTAARPEGRLG